MREWTDEQKQAIEAQSGTLLICAAAGSGKTSVLTERIVRKLTDEARPVAPSQLLVVTFTNAAAAEMRSRISARLRVAAAAQPHSAYLRSLMARLDEMNVCTMDSYCMRLVREHFSACGVEPDYTMLDDGEERALKAQIARAVTDGLYNDPEDSFADLTRLFQSGRDDAALFDGILALSDFSMSEADPGDWLDGLARSFAPCSVKDGDWGKVILRYYAAGVQYCLALNAAALGALSEDETLRGKLESLYLSERNALSRLYETVCTGEWDRIGEALSQTALLMKTRFPTVRGYGDDPLKAGVKAKRDQIKSIVDNMCGKYAASETENAEDAAILAPAAGQLVAAVKRFNEALFAAKKEKNKYGFSDITHFAVALLYDPAAPDRKTPLARELSEELDEILIDEYQDTNRVQDRLFNCLSKYGENMFLVGDIKQSIYRFRLASPDLFTEKLEAYPRYDPAAPAKKSKIILSRNFRSREGVTDTVNYLFSALMSKECGEITYNEDEALVFGAKTYPVSDTPDTSFFIVDAPDKSAAQAEGEFIAELIKRKIDEGLTVFENDACRPARYGDFCILLRSVKNTAETYAAALRARGIPVYYDARQGFFETVEIRIALAFLRAVDDPLSDLDLLAAMLSPLGMFTPEQAAKIKSDHLGAGGKKRAPLYSALESAASAGDAQCAGFLALLERFRMLAATASADEVIDAFYNETPVLACVRVMESGRLREANLRALYESAVRFGADGEKNLCSFLRYIDMLIENGSDLRKGSAAADKNCVSILTMHGSKGLEFPFVIVGGLTKKFNLLERSSVMSVSHEHGVGLRRREPENLKFYDTLSSVAVKLANRSASLSEELRIYYVAFTRAKEKLFLVCALSNPERELAAAEQIAYEGALPPFYVAGAATPLQWFLPVLQRHPDASVLRTARSVPGNADFRIAFSVETLPVDAPADEAAPAPEDPALYEELRARANRPYAFAPVCGALSLHTASALKEERFSTQFFGKSVPAFMYAASLTPADIGTATHKFLENCDFSAADLNIDAECRRLVSLSRLTEAEAAGVDKASIAAFFSSPLFGRVRAARQIFKERSFTIARSVRSFDPAVPERFADEKTVVIGKIDLVFVEDDGKAVIVDYKTDHVKSAAELPARYAQQLEIYCEAVEKALGYEVKERILYSLTLRDFVHC